MNSKRLQPDRDGFTLLEVMLALLLASILLFGMWLCVDVQLRVVERGREEVEQAQLARTILRRMGDDLRSAVLYQPMDMSALAGLGAGVNLVELPEELGGQLPPELAGESAGAAEEAENTGEEAPAASSLTPQLLPGVYGTNNELQVDLSRLPRPDQYLLLPTGQPPSSHLSEVRTVSYYVVGPEAPSTGIVTGGDANKSPGLYRRELDRATALWGMEQGLLPVWEGDEQPIAPEVAAVEFMYFDGTEWLLEWDSHEREGLPLAIEIRLYLHAEASVEAASVGSAAELAAQQPEYRMYRLVVHLPSAEATTLEAANTINPETEAEGAGGTETGSGTSSGGPSTP